MSAVPKMSLWAKVIAGSTSRKSRFHDCTGDRIPLTWALRNGPRALATAIARVAFNIRPQRPWISYQAQRVMARHLQPSSSVLEYGSGMSTVWFAKRAGSVVSIEDDAAWHEIVATRLPKDGAVVDYRLATDRDSYLAAPDGALFDLILVDGKYRDDCVELGLERLRPGGILYFDNADHGNDGSDGDISRAVSMLNKAARERGWELTAFTDFAPTNFFVHRALMLRRA